MNSATRKWVRGIVGGAINSCASAVTVVVVDPVAFNPLSGGATKLGSVMVVSALFGAGLYLKQHPLPEDEA